MIGRHPPQLQSIPGDSGLCEAMQTAELITDSLEGVVENEAFFHKIAAVVHVRVVLAFNREPADLPTTLPFRVLSHEDKRGAQEDSVRIFEVIQHLVRNEEVSLGCGNAILTGIGLENLRLEDVEAPYPRPTLVWSAPSQLA